MEIPSANTGSGPQKTLDQLQPGTFGIIKKFQSDLNPSYQRRIEELGLHEGTLVECLKRPPFSSPLVLQLGGTVFAIERTLTRSILIEIVDPNQCCQNLPSHESTSS